jgi:class 3 adenylate cyclase/tetratricopeptide (TPR) repeat protein
VTAGAAVAARPAAGLEGERRVITLLFCDVTGSTALAGELDPEEWAEIMDLAFKRLIEPVYRYGGVVARLMGDSLLAFFGAPVAHEDDPQRAVLAGLDILAGAQAYRREVREQRGLDFNVRVGINTGLVVVGRVGSEQAGEYTAMGDAANLAARMEQTALPGTLQIGEDTYQAVAGLFEIDPLGPIEVKGKKEPVPAYRVLGRRPGSLRERGVPGLRSAMLGRDTELHLLQARVDELLAGQTGLAAAVIGEAGLGKSRLAAELHRWLERQGLLALGDAKTPLAWYEGRTLSYQSHTPYAPFVDLLPGMLGFQPGQPLDYAQIKAGVAGYCPAPDTTAPFLAVLLGIEVGAEDAERVVYLDPPNLRRRIFAALETYLDYFTRRQPLVLVFEDLHWADEASLALLEHLLAAASRLPLLWLFLLRPNPQDPAWTFHERLVQALPERYTCLQLQPLSEAQARDLVGNLLRIEDLPERVRALILRKADGNPFFVEEVIRSLLDSGLVVRQGERWVAAREIERVAISDTLSGVITARLDRLDEAARRVTQEAAVIGREFAYPALLDLHEQRNGQPLEVSLQILLERDLLREKTPGPPRRFAFKHILTQETAYQSLLHSRRRALHLRAAGHYQRAAPEQSGEIARHFLEAGQPARALPYLVAAGERAAHTYAAPEAIRYYRQAVEALSAAPDAALGRQAYEGLGSALSLADRIDEARSAYQAMRVFGQDLGDVPIQVSALNKLSDTLVMRLGQLQEADPLLSDAERLAREAPDLPGLVEMFLVRCAVCNLSGDFPGAVRYLDESVRVNQSLGQPGDVAVGLVHIANTQLYMTEFAQSWETAQQGLLLAQEIGNRLLQAELLSEAFVFGCLHQGDFNAAFRSAAEAVETAAQIGATGPESMAALNAGRIALEMGDPETALTYLERAVRAGEAYGMPYLAAAAQSALGHAYMQFGPAYHAQAARAQARAVELLDLPGGNIAGGLAWLDLGFSALARGDPQQAAGFFQQGLDVPTPLVQLTRPYHLAGMALAHAQRGDLPAAQATLDQARIFAEGKNMRDAFPLLRLAQARLHLARGDQAADAYGPAVAAFDRAAELAASAGLRPTLWQAHAGAARALTLIGQPEQAAARLAQARAVVEDIAAGMSQDNNRRAYLDSALAQINL